MDLVAVLILLILVPQECLLEKSRCLKCATESDVMRNALEGSGRVISGNEYLPQYKYPWMINMDKLNADGGKAAHCGGAIISRTHVLTAAHCVYQSRAEQFTVGLPSKYGNDSKTYKVRKIHPHPRFSYSRELNDIALLEIDGEFECNRRTRPICLPPRDNMIDIDEEMTITGRGKTTRILPGNNRPEDHKQKEGKIFHTYVQACLPQLKPFQRRDDIFCTTGMKQTPCKGDSGATVFKAKKKVYYTFGVTSTHTDRTCDPDRPAKFTSSFFFRDWIGKIVKNLARPPRQVRTPGKP